MHFLFLLFLFSQTGDAPPPELGTIHWLRNFETASLKAAKADKPLLVLFQEVPG